MIKNSDQDPKAQRNAAWLAPRSTDLVWRPAARDRQDDDQDTAE